MIGEADLRSRVARLSLEQKVRQSRGYWALGGKHFPTGTDAPNKPTVTVAKQWDRGLKELAQFADDSGLPLIVRLVPIVDTVKTDYTPVRDWLKDLQREYPRLTVMRPEILLYDAEFCWDYQHLNADGVAKMRQAVH